MFSKLSSLYAENRQQGRLIALVVAVFLAVYVMPAGTERFDYPVLEAFRLTHWYA